MCRKLAPFLAALTLLWIGLLPHAGYAQRPLLYDATVFAASSTQHRLPFWLTANRYGQLDRRDTNVGTRLMATLPFHDDRQRTVDYTATVDLLGRVSDHNTLHVHQLYMGVRYGKLQVTAGWREQLIGRVDPTLSLGSTTWSRNASPMPKLCLSTTGYVSVPGTRGYVSLDGYLAHGWLEESRFISKAYLHEKYLHLKLLPDRFPVNGHAGFLHHAMWAGTHPELGPQPASVGDFLKAFGGRRTGRGKPNEINTNHLAAYDFSLSLDLDEYRGLVYRQFYHEDTPSLHFRNPWDGLWGVSIKRNASTALVTGFLWEHLVMTRHNAKYSEGQPRGKDNYYNHSAYLSGWTYHGRSVGIPLLFADGERLGIVNNIVVAHHVGLEGTLPWDLSYRAFFTYSRNYGVIHTFEPGSTTEVDGRTKRRDQYSMLLEVTGPLLAKFDLYGTVALAVDRGAVYDDAVGGMLTLSWRGDMLTR